MAQILKLKMLFALKLNYNRGQFWREISNSDYFNTLQIIILKELKITKVGNLAKVEHLQW